MYSRKQLTSHRVSQVVPASRIRFINSNHSLVLQSTATNARDIKQRPFTIPHTTHIEVWEPQYKGERVARPVSNYVVKSYLPSYIVHCAHTHGPGQLRGQP